MIDEKLNMKRKIGELGQGSDTVLLCIAAIHGNEQAGILALKQFFRKVETNHFTLNGKIIGLIGNLKAVRQDKRYLSHDLNRMWTKSFFKEMKSKPKRMDELSELAELKEQIDQIVSDYKRVIILDLHTMSSEGVPFVCFLNEKENRKLSYKLPAPSILGLVHRIPGTLMSHYSQKGIEAICFEGGKHSLSSSVLNIEAMIWQMASATKILDEDAKFAVLEQAKRFDHIQSIYPRYVLTNHRHGINKNDQFQMKLGFENLSKVKKGQVIASEKKGDIRSPFSGRIILPLYQGQGNDGFFLGKEVSKFRLKLYDFLHI